MMMVIDNAEIVWFVLPVKELTRRTFKPPLQPILVSGPFRVAVNNLKLPLTPSGNHYVAVFMDYLTMFVSLSESNSSRMLC